MRFTVLVGYQVIIAYSAAVSVYLFCYDGWNLLDTAAMFLSMVLVGVACVSMMHLNDEDEPLTAANYTAAYQPPVTAYSPSDGPCEYCGRSVGWSARNTRVGCVALKPVTTQ
jgi:hypothetical protein